MGNKKETVLITGSSRGIGEGLALIFAKNGYNLIVHGRDEEKLNHVCKEIEKYNVNCNKVVGDINSEEILNKLSKFAEKEDVTVLINNAGLPCPHLPLEKITDLQVDDIIKTNLIAPIKLTRRVYKFFMKKKNGTIININSLSGIKNHYLRSIYCSSKWGLRGFTDTLRQEAKDYNIRILSAYPGRTMSRSEYTYGMTVQHVATKIFDFYESSKKDELILDNRKKVDCCE